MTEVKQEDTSVSLEIKPTEFGTSGGDHWCCGCIPLRAGVVMIAVQDLWWMIAKLKGIIMKQNENEEEEDINTRYDLIPYIIIYFIACCFGIIGALNEYKNMMLCFRISYYAASVVLLITTAANTVTMIVMPAFIELSILITIILVALLLIGLRIYFMCKVKTYYFLLVKHKRMAV